MSVYIVCGVPKDKTRFRAEQIWLIVKKTGNFLLPGQHFPVFSYNIVKFDDYKVFDQNLVIIGNLGQLGFFRQKLYYVRCYEKPWYCTTYIVGKLRHFQTCR